MQQEHFTEESAEAFFSLLTQGNKCYEPMKFNHREPIKNLYDAKHPEAAINMLSMWGSIFLKRVKPTYLIHVKSGGSEVKRWSFDMAKDYYMNKEQCASFIELLKRLFEKFTPIYVIVSLEEDRQQKHKITDPITGSDLGDRGTRWVLGEGLPGIYWFNIFGPALVEHFGREKLLNIQGVNSFCFGEKCVAVQAYSLPSENDSNWRRSCEDKIVKELGADYFFDNKYYSSVKRPRRRKSIAGVDFNKY